MHSLKRHTITYFSLSIFTFVFNFVYSLFSHGVISLDMQRMYLVLFAVGLFFAFFLFVYPKFEKRLLYRTFVNSLNASTSILVIGMALKGIIDIAGGSSNIIPWYFIIAQIGLVLSFVLFLLTWLPLSKIFKQKQI
jgi:hypothetical protein